MRFASFFIFQVRSFLCLPFFFSLSPQTQVWNERSLIFLHNLHMHSVFRRTQGTLFLLLLVAVLAASGPGGYDPPSCEFHVVPVYSDADEKKLSSDKTYEFNARFVFPLHEYLHCLSCFTCCIVSLSPCRKVKIVVEYEDLSRYSTTKAYIQIGSQQYDATLSGNEGSSDVAVLTQSSSLSQDLF